MQKAHRNIGFILLFLFLTGQSCDVLWRTNFSNGEPLSCDTVVMTSLIQDENGNVQVTWDAPEFASFYMRLFYQGSAIASYNLSRPSASFRIDWQTLQGTDGVYLELTAEDEFTPDCKQTIFIERPVPTALAQPSMFCANLALTSPLGGMANGMQTFYWNVLEGASAYRLNIYDDANSSQALASVDAGNALSTSLDVNQAAIGGESPLLVELVAFDANGNTCSQSYEIAREAAPPQIVPATATPTCDEAPKADYC